MKHILSLLCLVALAETRLLPCLEPPHNPPICHEKTTGYQKLPRVLQRQDSVKNNFGLDDDQGQGDQGPGDPDYTEWEINHIIEESRLNGADNHDSHTIDYATLQIATEPSDIDWPFDQQDQQQQGQQQDGQDQWSDGWSTGNQGQQQNGQDSWSDEWPTGQDYQQDGQGSWSDEWPTGQQDQQQNGQGSWSDEWPTGQDYQQDGQGSSTGQQDQQQNGQHWWSDEWTTGQQDQQQNGQDPLSDECPTGQQDYQQGQEWVIGQEDLEENNQHQNHPNVSEDDLDELYEWMLVNMPGTQQASWSKK